MVEASENIDFVTLKRQRDLECSRREFTARAVQPTGAEGQPHALEVQESPEATTLQPEQKSPSADSDAAFRHVRISVMALLVVVLVVVWFRQKKNAA